ncbi:MAG: L-seryl-tRNA(Sec) selenium transferase, partial [Gammaproteobacteria bacterium]|nr:L-seryl-tRNA(Sec) selenium transferase [Gammaproteobacteria bacterium]
RPDKMILAALVETLRLHCSGLAFSDIPVLHRLAMPQAEVQERAEALSRRLQAGGVPPECLELRPGFCRVGGGSSPSGQLPTTLVCLDPRGTGADRLAARLRTGVPAVVGRIADDHFLLDLRGIAPEEDELLAEAVLVALEREE